MAPGAEQWMGIVSWTMEQITRAISRNTISVAADCIKVVPVLASVLAPFAHEAASWGVSSWTPEAIKAWEGAVALAKTEEAAWAEAEAKAAKARAAEDKLRALREVDRLMREVGICEET
jgi:hypothetical protein